MAEHKDKHKESSHEGLHIVEVIFGILILLYFLHVLGGFLSRHFGATGGGAASGTATTTATGGFLSGFSSLGSVFSRFFVSIFPTIELFSIFLSLLFFMAIIFTVFRLYYLRKLEHLETKHKKAERFSFDDEAQKVNPKWQRVLEHINSLNPTDWRLAILEADILLGDMLEKMGYHGDGIGDMLKKVEKSDFNTIDNAWEAHKIRNAIAHEGADFLLSKREAERAIGLYQSVFEEFHFA